MHKIKLDELKVSWDDNIHKLIHTKCHKKHDYFDIKCHMTLNIVFSIPLSERNIISSTKYN
jgi:hypothetical protein